MDLLGILLKPLKPALDFVKDRIPRKEKIRGECVAEAEGRIESSEKIHVALERIGWNKDAAKIGATMEMLSNSANQNIMETMMKAESYSASPDFLESLAERGSKDMSVIGPVIEASWFVGDEYLRDLLGRILAGDVDRPGSVSPITVSVAKNLNTTVLRKFLRLRAVTWFEIDKTAPDDPPVPFSICRLGMSSWPDVFYPLSKELGFHYSDWVRFEFYRLTHPYMVAEAVIRMEENSTMRLRHGTREILLKTRDARDLGLGNYRITDAGSEIIGTYLNEEFDAIDGYFEEVCNRWRADGFDVEVSNSDKTNNALSQ